MNKENNRGASAPLPFTGIEVSTKSNSINLNHIYEDEGWGVFTVYKDIEPFLEVQRLDDLSILENDDAAIPLAKRRGYKVGSLRSDYEVTNIDEVEGFLDRRITNKRYTLNLPELEKLVDHVISKKFYSVIGAAGGVTTIELIKQYLNNE